MLLLVTVSVMVTLNMFLPTHCFKQCVDHEFLPDHPHPPAKFRNRAELPEPSRTLIRRAERPWDPLCLRAVRESVRPVAPP